MFVYNRHSGRRSNRSSGAGSWYSERLPRLCSHVRYMGICYILVYILGCSGFVIYTLERHIKCTRDSYRFFMHILHTLHCSHAEQYYIHTIYTPLIYLIHYTILYSYSLQRKSFNQPISSLYAIQAKLADMSARIDAARLCVYYSGDLY